MASFVSILKKVGQIVLGVEPIAAQVAGVILPQFSTAIHVADSLFQNFQTSIATAEANNPLDGQGQLKSEAVVTDFAAGLSVTQQVLAIEGKTLQYDAAKLQAAINAQVAAFNAFRDLKGTFKVVALPAAAPVSSATP